VAIGLIASYQLKSTVQGTTALVTPSFTPTNGEVITVTWETFDPAISMTIANSGSQTIAQKILEQPGGFNGTCGINAGTVSGSPGSMTITGTPSASARYSMTVERWSGAVLAATPVTNGATSTTTPAASTITPTGGAGGRIVWVAQDAQSVNPSTRTYAGSGTDDGLRDDHASSDGVGYHGYQTITGNTSQSYGLTLPTGQKWVIAGIEVKPAGGSAVSADATLAVTATLTAAATTQALAAATLPVTATLSGAATEQTAVAASLAVTATLTSAATRQLTGASSFAVTATLTSAATRQFTPTAALPVTATLTAAATLGAAGNSTLAATASFTDAAQTGGSATASLPVTATLAAAAAAAHPGDASLAATATFTAAAGAAHPADAALSVLAGLTAAGTVTSPGSASASLAITATLTGNAVLGVAAGSTLPVTATLAGSAALGASAAATLPVTATLIAAATRLAPGAGSLAVTAALTAAATGQAGAGAALSVTASLSAAATAVSSGKTADASLSVAVILSAGISVLHVSQPNGWRGLMGIIQEARIIRRDVLERDILPISCPHDGEVLSRSVDGILYCRWDGYVPEGQAMPTDRNVGGGDWGGLRGVIEAARADSRQDQMRRNLACPHDGEPYSRSIDGILYCAFDLYIPPQGPGSA
jgi:hypothetical protein